MTIEQTYRKHNKKLSWLTDLKTSLALQLTECSTSKICVRNRRN